MKHLKYLLELLVLETVVFLLIIGAFVVAYSR